MFFEEGYSYTPYLPEAVNNGNGPNSGLENILDRIAHLPEEDVLAILEELSARQGENSINSEADQYEFKAQEALNVIDNIIKDVYLPFRGAEGYETERAILVEDPHVPHRENDAEHSWHIAFTLQVFWDNRAKLGINFPPNFNMQKALQFALKHDVVEIWADDVDAMTQDLNLINQKKDKEIAAHQLIKQEYPYLNGIADIWEEYEHKSSFEAQLVSDLDKIAATRMICLDGGNKWHDWEGYASTRQMMSERFREKLITPIGHALWDELERDIDNHPEYFPAQVDDNNYQYYPHIEDEQGRLFV
jgi:5'-deoxynucleotidase YfbR-like HD superfamily hydrolase